MPEGSFTVVCFELLTFRKGFYFEDIWLFCEGGSYFTEKNIHAFIVKASKPFVIVF